MDIYYPPRWSGSFAYSLQLFVFIRGSYYILLSASFISYFASAPYGVHFSQLQDIRLLTFVLACAATGCAPLVYCHRPTHIDMPRTPIALCALRSYHCFTSRPSQWRSQLHSLRCAPFMPFLRRA